MSSLLTYLPCDEESLASKVFHDQQEPCTQQAYLHLLYYKVALMDSIGSGKSDDHIPKK
jgi:hypothetical protein